MHNRSTRPPAMSDFAASFVKDTNDETGRNFPVPGSSHRTRSSHCTRANAACGRGDHYSCHRGSHGRGQMITRVSGPQTGPLAINREEEMMKSDDSTNRVRAPFSITSTRCRSLILAGVAAIGFACCPLFGSNTANAQQQQARPNILVIFGDDVGERNISAYSHGLVGYRTPNIDRIAKEGMMFTDYYAENSCTA